MFQTQIKKILRILTKKEKIYLTFSLIILLIKSILDVLSIGMLVPILNFLVAEESYEVFNFLPFLKDFSNNEILLLFVMIFISIYFFKTLFVLFFNRWYAKFSNILTINITNRLLHVYLYKKYNYFVTTNPATILRNLTAETSIFTTGIISQIITIISQLVFIISVCAFLVFYNFYTLYVILTLASLSYIIIKSSNTKFKKWGDIRQKETNNFIKKLNELIGSIKEIILYNKENFFAEETFKHNRRLADANIYRDTSVLYVAPLIEFFGILIFFCFLIILIFFSKLSLDQIIVLFGIFAFASIKLMPGIISIIRSIQMVKFNIPAIKVLEDLLDYKNLNLKTEDYNRDKFNIEKIKFNKVNFKYKNESKNIINDANFEIKKGDKIAIIGETGSGKTTLLNLISTLISPTDGFIEINNDNNKNLLLNLKSNIGYVSQSVYLADDTVFFNVSLSNKLSEEDKLKILDILESLNLRNINNKKIETIELIGDRGSKLSGGQVQRIGIARAVFRDPQILILDESTNALDATNESKTLEFLLNKFSDRIIIICTHKKEILKYCNKVFKVNKNTVEVTDRTNINK